MNQNNKIMVVGDLHGDWGFLNALVAKKRPETVICCGDFGWWPGFHGKCDISFSEPGKIRKAWKLFGAIKNREAEIHFAPGNHEDWDDLDKIQQSGNLEVLKGVFYKPKGSVMTLPDGRNVLFWGGAESIDKNLRTIGIDWFPQETSSYKDIFLLDSITCRIDIVVSHTCPSSVDVFDGRFSDKMRDPTTAMLDCILDTFKPSLWYFGHFHCPARKKIGDCLFVALNRSRQDLCWTWLE